MTSKPPSSRVELLKNRNEKLSAQTSVQREEIHRLQRRLEEAEEAEAKRQETLLCVNRLWEELNSAIAFLNYRASGSLDVPDAENAEAAHAALLDEANPFLAKLLGTYLPKDSAANAAAKGIATNVSEVEAALRSRMEGTMRAASQVLQALENGAVAGGSAASSAKEPQLAALNNLLRAENARLRDQTVQDAVKVRELQSSLADKEEELLVEKRKLVQLKEAAAVAPPATQPSQNEDGAVKAEVKPEADGNVGGPSPVDGAQAERLGRQVERLVADVEARDAALSKAEREIRELRSKLSRESAAATRARQYSDDRAHHLTAELDHLDARLRDSHRERDHLVSRLQDAHAAAEQGASAARRLTACAAHVSELEAQLASVRASRADAEAEVHRLKAARGNASTADELAVIVNNLKKDLAQARQAAAQQKTAAEGADAAVAQAAEARRALEESQAQLEVVRERLRAVERQDAVHAAEKQRWTEREEELRLFAEVAQSFLGAENGQAEELSAQVQAFLKQQEAEVAARLASAAETAAKAAEGESPEARGLRLRVEELEEEKAALIARAEGLQAEAAQLRQEVAALREEGEAFMKEMESVTEAYEASREQNIGLLDKIRARDDNNSRLLAEAATAARERSAMVEERDAALAAARRAEEAAAEAASRVAGLEGRIKQLSDDLTAARADARQLAARSDAAARDLAGAQAALAVATRDVEEARKEAAAAAAEREAEAEAARKERTRAERAERDIADLQGAVQRSQLPASGDEVAAECTALRKMVTCNVCSARLKDRIITKCNHLFCSHCIDANLATRHRKCPGCGERFGTNDVKPFYFT